MKKITNNMSLIYTSFMIFGIFFGAGNLIFPTFLGKISSGNLITSILFFSISAIIMPMLGIVVTIKRGGMNKILEKVGFKFKKTYPLLIYLSLGPGLAIPRAASISFELLNKSVEFESINLKYYRLIFTLIFFLLVFILSQNSSNILKNLGKVLTPILLILILIMFVSIIFYFSKNISENSNIKITKSFLEGYNTMDGLGSMIVGYSVYNSIKRLGIKKEKDILKFAIKSVLGAGILIFIIYFILAYIGYLTSVIYPESKNGVDILSFVMGNIFGKKGIYFIFLVFSVSCISASTGLSISISSYFSENYKIISYKKYLILIIFFSFLISNFTLNYILTFSIPILLMLYPVTIVLIFISIFENEKIVYISTVTITVLISVISVLNKLGFKYFKYINKLPLDNESLSWLIPVIIVYLLVKIFKICYNKL